MNKTDTNITTAALEEYVARRDSGFDYDTFDFYNAVEAINSMDTEEYEAMDTQAFDAMLEKFNS